MYHVPLLFNVYVEAVMKEVKWEWRGGECEFSSRREWRLPGLLYPDDVVFFVVSRRKT